MHQGALRARNFRMHVTSCRFSYFCTVFHVLTLCLAFLEQKIGNSDLRNRATVTPHIARNSDSSITFVRTVFNRLESRVMTEIREQTSGLEVCRVAVRLPPFWADRHAIWFAQAESQFELAAITRQRTKFNYVVSQLNQQQGSEVENIITAPPEREPYDRLKAELIHRLSTSREQRVRQLFRTKKWVIENHHNSFAISKASNQTCLMTSYAQFGLAVSHLMYRRSLPGRQTAISNPQLN